MTSSEKLAAIMIQGSASSLAGFAAAQMMGNAEDDRGDFDIWKSHTEQRLLELCAALTFEEPELLVQEVRWSRAAFGARGLATERLGHSLDVLSEVLTEQLTTSIADHAVVYLEKAKEGLTGEQPEPLRLDPDSQHDRSALVYLERVLSGDRRGAIATLTRACDEGVDPMDIYETVLIPAQREIGELWHNGELGVAEEHFCTATTQRAMGVLVQHALASRADSETSESAHGTVLAAATSGNDHDMASRVLTDFFEINGWKAILIGKDIPANELARGIENFDADLLLLSATLTVHLPTLEQTIKIVRELTSERQLRVLVGGRAFRPVPELWRKVGADGFAASARDALQVASDMFAN